ncbi:MAG: insulinase family protein [Myxococcaceae bacterium]|nr:insulinase family protein [Myxococcaceae bacterium]
MLALLAAVALTAAAPGGLPFQTKTTTLKNGLTVVRVPFASPGLLAWYSVVRVGSRNEVEAGHTGFAHFFEHIMFKGTKAYPEGASDAVLGKLGFAGNAYTTDDVTVYHAAGPSSGLEQLIEIEADRFKNLEYGEATFQTEAKAVLGEYNKNAANPLLKIEETMLATAFKSHTYRHTTLGFLDDIKEMPSRYEYSKQFFKRWYTPDNVMIFVVGDFDEKKLMAAIEKHYGSWAGSAATVEIPKEGAQAAARTASLTWGSPTLPRHLVYWKVPAGTFTGTDTAVQLVVNEYVAGKTSPLYKSLVLEKQLVEAVEPDYGVHRDPYLFGVFTVLKEEGNRAQVDAAVLAAVKELSTGTVDAARLKSIQDHLRYEMIMQLETPDAIANALSRTAGILGSPDALDAIMRKIAAVKPADVQAYARKHLVDENRTTLVFEAPPAGGAR